jgi:hypothetical protein
METVGRLFSIHRGFPQVDLFYPSIVCEPMEEEGSANRGSSR